MAKKMNVLFAAFEATPFIKTGGLGDVAGSLPSALKGRNCDIRVILPKLRQIPQKYRDKMQPLCTFQVPLGWRMQYCGIETLKLGKITYYFVDNEYYFFRDSAYGYGDDCERVAFFSKAILECLQHLPDFFPDILHCNDWHTALVPVFLHEQYQELESYRNIRTVLTIHNLKFQGICGEFALGDLLGLHECKNALDQLHWGYDAINFLQGGLYYTDYITTVSPTYAQEICTPAYGEHLDGVLSQHRDRLAGILNGIDTKKFSPAKALFPFSPEDLSGKKSCKAALQQELGLPQRADTPLLVLISRLTDQKGLDLLAGALGELVQQDLQLAVLGTGDEAYERLLGNYAAAFPEKVALRCTFDEPLSCRMYAGADMLLMPSLFEPCGLSQMIAMGYGTLPIVRETGGLRDSVTPYNRYTGEGTGFRFSQASAQDLKNCVLAVADLYRQEPDTWRQLQAQAMAQDFGWKASAKEYLTVYQQILS
jgi:starch synthase